jgi:hypothetical protein
MISLFVLDAFQEKPRFLEHPTRLDDTPRPRGSPVAHFLAASWRWQCIEGVLFPILGDFTLSASGAGSTGRFFCFLPDRCSCRCAFFAELEHAKSELREAMTTPVGRGEI